MLNGQNDFGDWWPWLGESKGRNGHFEAWLREIFHRPLLAHQSGCGTVDSAVTFEAHVQATLANIIYILLAFLEKTKNKESSR